MNIDKLINRTTSGTVVVVAGFAAAVSYSHIRDLAIQNGYDNLTGSFLPLSVDGLLLGCSLLLMAVARNSLKASVAKFGMWLGVVATLCANVAYGLPHGVVGALVSAWPAAAFIVLIEAVLEVSKRKKLINKNTAVAKPTRRAARASKRAETSINTKETQASVDLGEGGSVEHRVKKDGRGRTSKVKQVGENEGIPTWDGIPTAYQVATAIRCGHAKSKQLRQIMIDDNVDLHAAINIRNTRKENAYV